MTTTSRPSQHAYAPTQRTSLREAQKHLTRQRLIEAAAEVLADKGYEHATIDDVALRANVGRTTVYKYFNGKPQLAEAVASDHHSSMLLVYRKIGTVRPDDVEGISRWLSDFSTYSVDHARTANMLPQTPEVVAGVLKEVEFVAGAVLMDWAQMGWEPAIPEAQQSLRLLFNLVGRWNVYHFTLAIPEPPTSRAALLGILNNELMRIVRRKQQ